MPNIRRQRRQHFSCLPACQAKTFLIINHKQRPKQWKSKQDGNRAQSERGEGGPKKAETRIGGPGRKHKLLQDKILSTLGKTFLDISKQ